MIFEETFSKEHESIVNTYKTIVDSTREMIFIICEDFSVEFVNKYAAEQLELNRNDITGQKIDILFPPDIASMHKKSLKTIFETGEYKQEISYSKIGSKTLWLDTLLMPLKDSEGVTIQVLGISRDITTRIKAENALRESEEKYRMLIENANDGIYIRDKEGILEFVNDKILEINGYERDEMIGKKSWEFIHPEDIESVLEEIDLKKLNENFCQEARIITKSGEIRYVDINTVPFLSTGGEGKVFGICRDVTERRKTEQVLKESEERYKLLIEEQGEGIGITDVNEVIRFANPAAESIFGVKRGELLNRSLEEFTTPEEFKKLRKETQKRGKGKKSTYETEIICPDGKKKFLHLTATPKYDKNGKFEGTFGIFRDITAEKDMEKALRESEERFKRFTEITHEGIIIHKNGIIIDVNPSIIELFGYDEKEIKNREIYDFITPQYREIIREKIIQQYSGVYEFEAIKKDGTHIPVEVTVRPVKFNNETFRVVSLNDITKRKKDEEALRKSEKELKEANLTKDRFFSILAHDLRSPVSNIMQFAKLLEEKHDEISFKEFKEYIHFISRLAGNTYNLLENLLTWSRIQLNKMDFSPVEFNLNGVVESVVQLFQDDIKKKKLSVFNEIDKNIMAFANEKSLEVVLRNLISNAIKFTPDGGKISIYANNTVTRDKGKSFVEICVKDTGVGIPDRNKTEIFHIDTIFSTEGTNNEKGTGLGLVLCREFVEKNGGEMYVKSEVGKGSTFCFTVPANYR